MTFEKIVILLLVLHPKILILTNINKFYKTFIFLFLFNLLYAGTIFAQNIDSTLSSAIINAKTFYTNTISSNSKLYIGGEETIIVGKAKGHPYYLKQDWQVGSLIYDGILYENVKLKYNLASQKLILQHYGGYLLIELVKDKISSFTIGGHAFVQTQNSISWASLVESNTFYRQIWDNKYVLLSKYTKLQNNEMVDSQVIIDFSESKDIIFLDKKEAIKLKSISNIEKIFPQKDVKKYAKSKDLDFKNEPENAFCELIKYCEIE